MPTAITPEIVLVFLVVAAALVLFATEALPVDITAIGVMVVLMLLQPLSVVLADLGLVVAPLDIISPEQGVSGFASAATLTVLAMFVLSDGVQRTGIVQRLGHVIGRLTGDSQSRQLAATIGAVGPISGFINNTAAVAILLPMVSDLAHEGKTSPSKLLIPLSYASMFGGMLTVIGTSTNILASDLFARLGGRPFGMFEFTLLGAIISVVGAVYLMTVGHRLIPPRIPPAVDLTDEFGMSGYLTEVKVREDSPIIGNTVQEAMAETGLDVDVLQLIRDEEPFLEPLAKKEIRDGDLFVVRASQSTLLELLETDGLDVLPDVTVDEAELERPEVGENLVEVVIGPGSPVVGETLESANFRGRFDASVIAMRRGDELIRKRLEAVQLRVGDALLIQAPTDVLDRSDFNREFIVAQEIERRRFRESKVPVALGIVVAVVGLAAVGVLSIMVAALTGALAMVLTGCLKPGELYESIQWDVVFLLAGVIPLGIAMEQTGAASLLAETVLAAVVGIHPVLTLAAFYLLTALLTNVISNNASVVLMVPVAYEAALSIGASPFSYVLAVAFAASTAFMTPVGYQTNLFVYGPGGYRFTDYLRVGGPLQLLFTIVTPLGIWWLFGV